jgi:hypothetical protein
MALSWPSVTGESCYRWYWLGPVCITVEAADDLEWAQCHYSALMLMPWGGPIASHKYAANDLEWPQCWCPSILLMV